MRPRVGDNALRVFGTNAGFRVRSSNQIVAVETHIQLRNDEGLTSKFLPVDDFIITANRQRETVWSYLIVWRNRNGETCHYVSGNVNESNEMIRAIAGVNGTVLAKKKIRVEI